METTQSYALQGARPRAPSRRYIALWAFLIIVASLAFPALVLWRISPARASISWHLRHGNQIVWQNTRFHLPLAWSGVEPRTDIRGPEIPGPLTLYRQSWLPFTSAPYSNWLEFPPAVPVEKRDRTFAFWRGSMRAGPWGPVSEYSRTISTHAFHCASQPDPSSYFLHRHLDRVHAFCFEQNSGWLIFYWGAPKYFDEALEFFGKGETLHP